MRFYVRFALMEIFIHYNLPNQSNKGNFMSDFFEFCSIFSITTMTAEYDNFFIIQHSYLVRFDFIKINLNSKGAFYCTHLVQPQCLRSLINHEVSESPP